MAIATIGSRLTYTIVVQNTGTLPAQNVTFTDPYPLALLSFQTALQLMALQQQEYCYWYSH